MVVVTAFAHESFAAPEGSLIVGGSAIVTQTGPETIIQQSSDRAIIRWNSFDVAQNEKVNFQQPSSNSITINRITDNKASRIDGNITANGKLVMVNPNGVVFGATSRVDVGSLVATSSDIEDDVAFLAGGPANFTKSGNPNAQIINAGTITARDAGLVGLVAPNVENSGVIQARLGKVQLASGDIHTIDLAGDGLIKLEISDKVLSQNVKNTGTLQADGGEITMTAAQGKAALDAIISNHGRIQSGTVFASDTQVVQKGKVTIKAATNKTTPKTKIINSGTIVADGGTVEMIADTVNLENTSTISVAADNAGGAVYIGGARQGGASLPTAQFINVEAGSVIDASALTQGNGGEVVLWSDLQTNFGGKIISTGGSISGNGGEIEVSSKGRLNYRGFTDLTAAKGKMGNLLLDPTDILITASPDTNMSGSSPFTPTIDDGPSVLDVATLTSALGSASVTVQTRATGSQQGNITVNAPISWSSGNTLTLDAHHDIIINQAISGQNLTLIAGNDVQIGAALNGMGILTIMPASDAQTIGIGNSSAGTLQINTTELSRITNGWNQIIFGRETGTAQMDVQGATWNDHVLLRSDTGVIHIADVQNFGANNLSIATNADLSITAPIVGSGTLTISSLDPSVGVGVGTGQAGAVQLNDSDLSFIINGWTSLVFGNSSLTGDLNVGAYSWLDNLVLQTGSGTLSINGTQNLGSNNLLITADSNPVIAADLIGTGTLTFQPGSAGLTMGVGAGASGVFNLDAAEFAHVQDGWSQIYLGRIDSTALMDLRALSWLDRVRLYAGVGVISINDAQNFNGNDVVFQTDGDIALNAALTGTGNITFRSNLSGTSIGLAGEAGTINLTAAELNQIQNGFSLIQFGSQSAPSINPITIGAYTWQDNVLFTNSTGVISFTGAQNFGSNALTIRTDSDLDIAASLVGTGTITISGQAATTDIGLGTGQTGALSLNATDLANITNGWTDIIIGRTDGTGAMNVGANVWNDNLELRTGTGIITINGTQTMGANNLTLSTGSDAAINGALTGTGTLTLRGIDANTTIGVGTGQLGSFQLSNADLGNITNGWSDIIIGRTDGTGAINVGALTWNDNLTYQSATGGITIAGVQTMGANNLTLSTDIFASITAGLTGTGNLNLRGNSASTIMGIGTGQAGGFQLTNADIANFTDGWSNIVIGRTDGTGDINIGALTWNDNLILQSNTGYIIVSGIQTLGANNVTFTTDGDPQINAAMNSTGTLTFQGLTDATTIGVGTGQAGTLSLSTTDLNNADNTWTNIIIGRSTQTGAINAGNFTLADPLILQTGTGVITVGAAINMGANSLTFQTDADPVINATLTGTQTIYFLPTSNSTTIGVGNGQAGTISIDDAEQARIVNGWTNIVFGRVTGNGAINLGSNLTWQDNLFLRSTGSVTINGVQNFANNTFSLQTDSDPTFNGTLAGTGNFTLTPIANAVSMGIGDSQMGTVNLTNAELNNILNGWALLTFGLTSATADINIGAYTWQDNLNIRTGTGIMNVNGTQTMGANNLTLNTDSNLNIGAALTGTGTLTIAPTANTTVGIGTGQTGTLALSDTELNNITDGWSSLVFGSTTSTAAINVGAKTWTDNVSIRSGSGVMTIAGAQTMGGNNLTLVTDSNLALNAALTGTGVLTIAPVANTTMGIGTGQTGTLSLTDTELNRITDGWNSIILGNTASTAAVNVGLRSWNDNLILYSGTGLMTIAAAQSMGANNLTIVTDSNLTLNANLTGTGILTIRGTSTATTMSLGTGQTGTLNLSDTELLRIVDGWTRLDFGSTNMNGVLNVGTATWNDSVRLMTNGGVITVNGVQNFGSNNLDISTNADPVFNAAVKGTGTLSVYGSAVATTMGIGDGQTGTLQLSNSDLAYLSSGWNNMIFGASTQTGAMNIGAYNWQYDTTFRTGTGVMSILGENNSGPRNMTFETDSSFVLNAPLTGSGILNIRGSSNATTMGIGSSATGTLWLADGELIQLTDGWSKIVFGKSTATGAVNVAARTWNDSLQVISGTGLMTITGAQNMGANNLTLETDSNLAINGALNGTGNLAIRGASLATTIGVNGAAGTLALSTAEIANLADGWGSVMIGRHDMTGAISLGTATWLNPTTFMTRGDVNISGVQTSTETSGNSLVFVSQSGVFTNTAGASAINPGGGRYLIYAVDVASANLGGLSPPSTINGQTYFSLYPADVVPTGNVVIYSTGAAKVLLIQIDDKNKVYGDTNPTFTYTFLGGLQGADTLAGALTSYTLNAAGTSLTDNAGTTWAITGSFTTALGYTTNVINGTMTVAKAPVLVQANAASRTYGAANPTFTMNYIGLKNGETSGVIDTLATGSTAAGLTSNVGTYSITSSGAVDNNYVFNYANGTLTVTKANLTVTADDKTREYGDANPALTLSYTGFLNGDTSAVIDTAPTLATTAVATTAPSNVAITMTGGLDNNYNLVLVNGTLTITKANLSVVADNKTRSYGTANPSLTYTFGTFKNGETSAVLTSLPTISTTATATTNVGTTPITLSGGSDAHYNYVFTNGTLTITKATLTATVQNANREYGDANPAFTIVYTGFMNGETQGVIDTLATASSTATNLSNVGTYVISGAGGLDNDYDINYVTGVLTITKANLSVVADNKTREYGDANPALTYTFGTFKNGQNSSVLASLPNLTTTATATTNVGTAAITLASGSDSNYNYVYTGSTLTITKATLTATAQNAARDYGDANPVLTVAYTGFKNSETQGVIDTLATASTGATNTTNAGTAVISAAGANDNNYNFTYVNGVLTINKANLSITADNKTREYGDANPVLTYTFGTFKNGETSAVLGLLPTISTTATATTNVGTAAINLSGGLDTNYNYVLTNGTLTITKAMLTATAQNAARDYGDANPALTIAYNGFKNSENQSVIDTLATASTTATNTTNAGTAVITVGGAADTNYDFTYVNGVLTIDKADLSVTADNKTREYGDANPALTYTFGTFKNGETSLVLGALPTISTTATTTTNVGTEVISLSGGSDINYNYVFTDGVLTITKADLAITADNKTREYGDANPALTYTFGTFKNGETSAVLSALPTISTTATNTTNVGTDVISLSGGSDTNYNYVFTDGVLTITKAILTATADNKTREYGDANPALTVGYTGFKNGENAGVIDTLATASTTATNTTNVGAAIISATGANDNNYDFVYVDGALTISKANLSVTADNKTREYGDANPALTYTFGTFKNGETSAVLGALPTISTAANLTTHAGTAAITLSGGSDTNYNYVLNDGVLTITKAAITVRIDDATRAEGEANPPFSYTILSGLKNGDPNNVVTGISYTSPTTIYTPRGTYVLNGSGGVATNYYISGYTSGILTITPGELPIKALPSTVYYSNDLGIKETWNNWRDLIYFEDENFIETILFGRKAVQRELCHENLGNACQSQI